MEYLREVPCVPDARRLNQQVGDAVAAGRLAVRASSDRAEEVAELSALAPAAGVCGRRGERAVSRTRWEPVPASGGFALFPDS